MPDSTRCPSEGLANLLCSSPSAESGKEGRREAVGAKYSGAPLRYLRFISGRDLLRGDGRERRETRKERRKERGEKRSKRMSGEKKRGRGETKERGKELRGN